MDIVVRGKNRTVPSRLQELTRAKVARSRASPTTPGRVEVDFSEVSTRAHRRTAAV